MSTQVIRDRVKQLRRVPASQLRPNAKNWREHPPEQLEALQATLAEIGFAGVEVCRELEDGTLELLDGHARAELAGDAEIPVLVVDLDDSEAAQLLATYDPIGAMATANAARLAELLSDFSTESAALQSKLDELTGTFDIDAVDFPELPEGERSPYRQMTFTLHDEQYEQVDAAIRAAKELGPFETENENANGNALARIAEQYLGRC